MPKSISLPIFTLSGRRPLRQLEYSSKPVPSTSSGCAASFTTTFFETDFTEKENIEPMTNIQLHSHKENEVVLARKEIKQLSKECRTPSLAVTQKIKKTIATTHAENKLRTVAFNMGYLAEKGILPKECEETAEVLLFFDKKKC
ncbi:unnamed protein product [Parnassius apollo]|uniref:(apollo) hypothetical protein n=1 Tax=Parnassius apollo TaxID=110799 RepID=A0A8S3X7A2_PARAO|nr:unnamed protein product [Parnassius apollo]